MDGEKLHIFSPGRRLKTAFLIILTVFLLVLFHDVVKDTFTLLFGSTIISFFLSPVARLLEKWFSPQKAAVLALVCAAAILVAAAALLVPLLSLQISVLVQKLPEVFAQIGLSFQNLIEKVESTMPGISLSLPEISGFQDGFSAFARNAVDYAGNIADKIYNIALMAVLGCFLLADRQRVMLRAELLLPSSFRRLIIRHTCMLLSELKMYIRGQITIAMCVGGIAAVIVMIIGLPGGIILGAIVGIFNIIPYFGPILGGIPAVLMALGESWQKAAVTLAALILVQQIDGMVISPRVMGNATGFSPAVVLIALYASSRLFGIAGLLFAMPSLMAIRTLYRVFVQRYEKN